ncbi:hypothetical protein KM043_010225 [Ampulex compressa]|nr:hypothetical protein KM043_010225 [Ampulex compressa]
MRDDRADGARLSSLRTVSSIVDTPGLPREKKIEVSREIVAAAFRKRRTGIRARNSCDDRSEVGTHPSTSSGEYGDTKSVHRYATCTQKRASTHTDRRRLSLIRRESRENHYELGIRCLWSSGS